MASNPYKLPDGDTTVLSRVNAIASEDSNLNQMAKVEALKANNRRGLLNSTMAVGASTDAVLRNAIPIASQDSSQAYGADEAAKDRRLQLDVQTNQLNWQGGQNAADRGQQILQRTWQGGQNNLDRALQQRIASWNVSSGDKQAASSLLANMEHEYENSVNSILGNQALSAADRTALLTASKNLRAKRLDLVEQLYNIDLKY